MAASIQESAQKLASKAGIMAQNYDASKGRAKANYGPGVARWLGQAPSASLVQAYDLGINNARYRAPDPQKWLTNTLAKFTGR